jgi:uncharacterized protein YuzE
MTQLFYDSDADTLYLSTGEARQAVLQEVTKDVMFKVNPETGAIVGILILNFMARFREQPQPIELPINVDLRWLK